MRGGLAPAAGRRIGPASRSASLEQLPSPQWGVISPLFATRYMKIRSEEGTGNAVGTIADAKGPRTGGGQRPREKNGGRGLEGKGPPWVREYSGGLGTSGERGSRLRPKGWGKAFTRARAADGGPRGGFRVTFRSHLKSLSLDVIFSSKLEIWYEALAMLTASIPPAGAVDAAARCRSSSRSRRLPLPGSQRDTDAD